MLWLLRTKRFEKSKHYLTESNTDFSHILLIDIYEEEKKNMYETILPARLESEENEKIEEEKIIEENEKARKLLNEESEKIEEEYEYPLGDIARMNVAIDHMFNNISLLLSQNMTNCSKDLSPKVTLEKITILKYRYAEYLF